LFIITGRQRVAAVRDIFWRPLGLFDLLVRVFPADIVVPHRQRRAERSLRYIKLIVVRFKFTPGVPNVSVARADAQMFENSDRVGEFNSRGSVFVIYQTLVETNGAAA